jgi:hypothetical protein
MRTLIPSSTRPILVTDAGFRRPWFQAVAAMGWVRVGLLRDRALVKPVEVTDEHDQWVPCRALYALARSTPRDMGLMDTVADHLPPLHRFHQPRTRSS